MSLAFVFSVPIRCARNARARATMSRPCSRVFRRTIVTTWWRTARSPSPANSAARTISLRRARSAPTLVDRSLCVGRIERKRRDLDVKVLAAVRHHAVGAHHESRRRRQRDAASVFERLPGRERGLFADNARALDFLQSSEGVSDAPMPCLELDRIRAEVGDIDRIGPKEITVARR